MSVFTTVGYGNNIPQSDLGRFMIIIACIYGLCVYALFVFNFQSFTYFNKDDMKVYQQIIIDKDQIKLNNLAGKLIKSYLMFTFKKRREQDFYKNRDCFKVMDFLQMIKYSRSFQGEKG